MEGRQDNHDNQEKGMFSHLAAYAAGAGHYPPPHGYPPPAYPPHGYAPHGYPHGYPPPAGYPPLLDIHRQDTHRQHILRLMDTTHQVILVHLIQVGEAHMTLQGTHFGGDCHGFPGILAGGAAAAAAAYGAHHLAHGGYHHHGGFYGHPHHGKFKHGKFKHGKFGKRWKHGIYAFGFQENMRYSNSSAVHNLALYWVLSFEGY
ncbi:hypothetical protein DH2020_002625 [Rehmannia glutinosa]|uniref:Uncharacterized protein n=1 Tax=Rehmannia glutinosa TaxID=99300 RepID=A0ABR0XUB0_REHGL